MTFPPPNPADRPDPLENMPAVRARVPEHVASGEISTGVIVVTGGTEYVLDFVRNLPRPNCVVSRVVLPHLVMPQFIDALTTNIELFRNRYGELPGMSATAGPTNPANPPIPSPPPVSGEPESPSQIGGHPNDASHGLSAGEGLAPGAGASHGYDPVHPDVPSAENDQQKPEESGAEPNTPSHQTHSHQSPRRQNPQEVYDDLKIRDEILSGAYANAVMIGHGPYEFSFDFITQFYPQPAVSARVFMASGHVVRLLDSLKTSWEQIRNRYGYPPKN